MKKTKNIIGNKNRDRRAPRCADNNTVRTGIVIPVSDVRRQYLSLKREIDAAVAGTFASGWFVLGPAVEKFETEFAAYVGARHAVAVANGTEALHLALVAAGIGRGDEVITVPNTAVFTALAISAAGATPVFADIDPERHTMSTENLEKLVTPRTKAVIPVHLYGQCADMEPIISFARSNGLKIIEDACQAHGARYRSKSAGAMGDYGCFSFYPTKNLGCYGDGGAITLDDDAAAARLRLLRNGGQSDRYHHDIAGFNSRLDEIQAAILSVKLRHLDKMNAARRRAAALYDKLLINPLVEKPVEAPGSFHVYHLYVVKCAAREGLKIFLAERGIQTQIHYPVPVHMQKAYSDLVPPALPPDGAEKNSKTILSLPMFPEITDSEIKTVAGAVNAFGG